MRVFEETQQFNQWWIQLTNSSLVGFLLFCFYKWYVATENVNKVAVNNITDQIISIIYILPIFLFIYLVKLKTTIDGRSILYQFFPFHRTYKLITWDTIQ